VGKVSAFVATLLGALVENAILLPTLLLLMPYAQIDLFKQSWINFVPALVVNLVGAFIIGRAAMIYKYPDFLCPLQVKANSKAPKRQFRFCPSQMAALGALLIAPLPMTLPYRVHGYWPLLIAAVSAGFGSVLLSKSVEVYSRTAAAPIALSKLRGDKDNFWAPFLGRAVGAALALVIWGQYLLADSVAYNLDNVCRLSFVLCLVCSSIFFSLPNMMIFFHDFDAQQFFDRNYTDSQDESPDQPVKEGAWVVVCSYYIFF